MLDKKDFSTIESLIKKNIKSALQEFFNTYLLPYFERSERSHKEIFRLLDNISKKLDKLNMKLDRIQKLQEYHTALNSSPRRTKYSSEESPLGKVSMRGRFKNSAKLVN